MLNVIKSKKIVFSIAIVIVLISIVSLCVRGLVQDVDFAGGTAIYINMAKDFDNNEVSKTVKDAAKINIDPQVQKSGETNQEAVIKVISLTESQVNDVKAALNAKYTLTDDNYLSIDSVSPTVGAELTKSAIKATAIAVILMLLYISFRFEFLSALTAIITLAFNIITVIGIYSVFGLSINTTFIAAILTILGYSINDTIVIFDRIRENARLNKKISTDEIINKSVNQSMTRSIYTIFTTLVTIIILFIIGVPSIREFALPLIIGITVGAFTSIFLASPLWGTLKDASNKKLNSDKKAAAEKA